MARNDFIKALVRSSSSSMFVPTTYSNLSLVTRGGGGEIGNADKRTITICRIDLPVRVRTCHMLWLAWRVVADSAGYILG